MPIILKLAMVMLAISFALLPFSAKWSLLALGTTTTYIGTVLVFTAMNL